MFNFGKDKDKAKEEQEKLGRTIANLSDQVGALQQQLQQRNKQIEQLMAQLSAAQSQAASSKEAQQAQDLTSKATQDALRDAQAQMRDLERQIGDLAKAKREAEEAAAAARAAAEADDDEPQAAGGLRVGSAAWVRSAGGKTLRRRSAPGLDSNVLDGLTPGTQLALLEGPVAKDNYTWWRIRVADGREGWVAGEELLTSPE